MFLVLPEPRTDIKHKGSRRVKERRTRAHLQCIHFLIGREFQNEKRSGLSTQNTIDLYRIFF